eukprot:scaffold137457_cov17-Prasinocladus_malaysianus.AAC.1
MQKSRYVPFDGTYQRYPNWLTPAINLGTLGDFGPIWQLSAVVPDALPISGLVQTDAPWESIGWGP